MNARGHDRLSALLFGPQSTKEVLNLKLFPGDFNVSEEGLRNELASAIEQVDTPGFVASHKDFDEQHLPDVDVAEWTHVR